MNGTHLKHHLVSRPPLPHQLAPLTLLSFSTSWLLAFGLSRCTWRRITWMGQSVGGMRGWSEQFEVLKRCRYGKRRLGYKAADGDVNQPSLVVNNNQSPPQLHCASLSVSKRAQTAVSSECRVLRSMRIVTPHFMDLCRTLVNFPYGVGRAKPLNASLHGSCPSPIEAMLGGMLEGMMGECRSDRDFTFATGRTTQAVLNE